MFFGGDALKQRHHYIKHELISDNQMLQNRFNNSTLITDPSYAAFGTIKIKKLQNYCYLLSGTIIFSTRVMCMPYLIQ